MPRDPNEIGALWIKSGAKGEYLTGTIHAERVVAFKNSRKDPASKQPDWRVLKAQAQGAKPKPVDVSRFEDVSADDVPF